MVYIEKLRQRTFGLLCLLAAIIAFSVSSQANDPNPGIYGEWPGHDANWNATTNADYSGWIQDSSWWKKTITPTTNDVIYFRLRYDTGTGKPNYQPTSDENDQSVVFDTEYKTWDKADGSCTKAFKIENATANQNYTIWFNVDTKSVKVTIDDPEAGSGWFLAGDFCNWVETGRIEFKGVPLTAVVSGFKNSDDTDNTDDDGFKVMNPQQNKWYGAGDGQNTNIKEDAVINLIEGNNGKNTTLDADAVGKNVTFTLTLENGIPKTLKATWSDTTLPPGAVGTDRKLPVFPDGVYSEQQLADYHEPVYYLQSMILNAERITPEYQMQKQADGTYALTFAMRNTTSKNSEQQEADYKVWVEGFSDPGKVDATSFRCDVQSFDKLTNNPTEGALYKAVFDPKTGKLTFEDMNRQMPFISMVSGDWKQNTISNNNEPFQTPSQVDQTTNMGWQESWIQYDAKGNILKDREGNVMYNTLWPPKNPIFFSTAFEVNSSKYDLTLDSRNLSLKAVGTKTGREWKDSEEFKSYANESLGNTIAEHPDELALDDDKNYTLYRVDNMWITGRTKFWTGWSGVTYTSNDAQWEYHSNWGHFDESTDAKSISVGSTVPLSNSEGDFIFNEPTYFRYVDFFYETSNPSQKGNSVLFTEKALAGAEIAASSRENYTKGMYRPQLKDIENISDYKLANVIITPWSVDGDESYTAVFDKDLSASNTIVKDFATLFTDKVGVGEGAAKFIYDATEYPNGNYKYVMKIVIEDTYGEKQIIEVESNPFTIYRAERITTLTAYQLVYDKDAGENHYVTFRGTANNEGYVAPEAPAYKVVDNNGQFTYELFGDELPDYGDESKYAFTNKALFVGNKTAGNSSEILGYKFGDDSEYSAEYIQTGELNPDRFMAVKDVEDLSVAKYSLSLKYQHEVIENGSSVKKEYTTTPAAIDFQLAVPEPKLIDAKIEMSYGKNFGKDESTDNDTAEFEYNGNKITARYQNLREIVKTSDPNVTDEFKSKISTLFKVTMGENKNIVDNQFVGNVESPMDLFKNNLNISVQCNKTNSDALLYRRFATKLIGGCTPEDNAPNGIVKFVKDVKISYSLDTDNTEVPDLIERVTCLVKAANTTANVVSFDGNHYKLHTGTAHDWYLVKFLTERDGKLTPVQGAEYLINHEDLTNGVEKTIDFRYGPWYDNQLSFVNEDPSYKHLHMEISQIYPFMTTEMQNTEESQNVVMRVDAGVVETNKQIDGTATTSKNFFTSNIYRIKAEDTTVGVDGIGDDVYGSVKSGAGFIEVNGTDVEIYSADGIKVAASEGRYELGAGVYMVRLNGRTRKVIVR